MRDSHRLIDRYLLDESYTAGYLRHNGSTINCLIKKEKLIQIKYFVEN